MTLELFIHDIIHSVGWVGFCGLVLVGLGGVWLNLVGLIWVEGGGGGGRKGGGGDLQGFFFI